MAFFSAAAVAEAQYSQSDFDPKILKINEDDYLGSAAPDIKLVDEKGQPTSLKAFSGKPLMLLMLYFDCTQTCPLLGENLASSLSTIGDLKPGEDYNVLVLSFNHADMPDKAREYHAKLLDKTKLASVDTWTFATAGEADIKALSEATGYRFFYSAEDGMFMHPNVFITLSPEQNITRYLFGTKPDAFNVRMAILESIEGKVGKVPFSSLVTLACYKYDSDTHGYVIDLTFLFASVGMVMAAMTGGLSIIVYRRRKHLKLCEGSER